jgi:ribonucleoside-diphosphate reductase alpha chain
MEGSSQTPFRNDVTPGEALSVKRFFTTPGQHAFDTVEWERRDARIGHGDKVAFEQRGVEFPKTWSQNATNIVAQKYFRGQLGSPTREYSVRQMIGRVAGTIADWGRARGYFASVEDGDAFESELAYILVHQMAAFNSPVWFNVGFEESPQCSACQPYGALISTPDGMVEIGDLVAGDEIGREVYDAHGVTRIVATQANGIKAVQRVRLRNGSFVDATADHVVKAVRERRGEPQWLRVDELEVGMRMHLHPHRAKVDQRALVVAGAKQWSDDGVAVDAVKASEAALAGWLQADGFVGRHDHGTNRSPTIEFLVANDEERAWIERHLDVALHDVHRHVRDAGTLHAPVRRIRLHGEALLGFVERWDLFTRGHEMSVPRQLWTASHDEIAAYLRSVFQANGYVRARRDRDCESARVGFAVIAEHWTQDIQILLGVLGIYSRRTRRADPRSNRHDTHVVEISIGSERARFAELVGFVDTPKQGRLLASLDLREPERCPDVREEEIVAIESLGEMDVYDIQTESGEYLCNNVAVHNCFILSVQDTMESILDWNTKEGKIFLGGSGSGINLSNIRGSMEPLSKGGTASGPVSFMRGADSWAGTIKSGGKTRRAAKMVVLDVDHPDIREFIWCKAKEEKKANALRDAGFDMSIDGEGFTSIQYQNANNSVRLSDDFMRAVEQDEDWHLIARATGQPVGDPIPARELMREIAEAAWQCADPGVQYDTTINQWHTCPASGRINASNPCFPADARVHTTHGLLPIGDVVARGEAGEQIHVYTHRATADEPGVGVAATVPVSFMRNGVKPIVRLRFANGAELRCTPNHRLWTINRGYVRAEELESADRVLLNDAATPAIDASWALPVRIETPARSAVRGGCATHQRLPERWTEGLGELTGHLIGDGWLSDVQTGWTYGADDIADGMGDSHEGMLRELIGGVSRQATANGTVQLRAESVSVRDFFRGLGVTPAGAGHERVPGAIFIAPSEIQAAFLRGLFGADGCVSRVEAGGRANRYVGLGSHSEALLKDVQRMLSTFGVRGRIYRVSDSKQATFSHTRVDGTVVTYASREGFDLRITGGELGHFATSVGFSAPRKQAALEAVLAETRQYATKPGTVLLAREDDGQEEVYNLTEPLHHSYIVDGFVVANCSEYMHVDDSACNLASLNLMKFRRPDGTFEVESFEHAVDVMFLAQEILVGPSSYPTEQIGVNARAFRQLGLGYANLGAYLMSNGMAYDSDAGRGTAAAITSLMTARAYLESARVAAAIGPYERYDENRDAHNAVMRMHRDSSGAIPDVACPDKALLTAAREVWDEAVAAGEAHGYRNAQATVLAPTGCLVEGSLVSTSRGLVRLRSLGDVDGAKWQDLDVQVATDEGPRAATKFYVNGMEQVVSVETARGYRLQGTPTHRIKVIDAEGDWVWKRMAEVTAGDRVPMMLNSLVGQPQEVTLPPLGDLHWNADRETHVPRTMSPELAELIGYFMGDGSLHAKGIRLCVTDDDVRERLADLGRELFGLEAHLLPREGYTELSLHSVPFTIWWDACGFAKHTPFEGHSGEGWTPHIPDAVLHSNDREVYAGFLRGLFEADGNANHGYAYWSTTSEEFARDVQTLMLALGFVTTRGMDGSRVRWGAPCHRIRLLNAATGMRFAEQIGFMSSRKNQALIEADHPQAARHDHIPIDRELVDRLAPQNDSLRKTMLLSLSRGGTVSRRSATALLERTPNVELEQLLGYFYDEVATTELCADEPTFDLSVPDNVTYVANGFVSHNTISFLMDCDTTGVEPDFSLVKFKELVGGGQMTIVNQTIPMALRTLGYSHEQIEQIESHIDEHATIVGAPGLAAEHLSIFDVAVGERAISHMGHIKMMGAVQPFISGAISKTVNLPHEATVEDIADAYLQAWHCGVKALAIYRDGSKTAQALRTDAHEGKNVDASAGGGYTQEQVDELIAQAVDAARTTTLAEAGPKRNRMPRERQSITHKFSIAGHEGYITAGMYEDGTLGEIFLTDIGKEGSTLRGLLNSFATSISMALQYGVPLEKLVEKFSYMRFEPEGITQNPEIPFAKSMPDYIMRWLASRFLDTDIQEELGIMTPEVRARKLAEDAGTSFSSSDTSGPANGGGHAGNGASGNGSSAAHGKSPKTSSAAATGSLPTVAGSQPATTRAAADALTDTPPVVPVRMRGLDLGPACSQCGGMMQRTGSCYTCSSCGNNTGCG